MLLTIIFGWCKNGNIDKKLSKQLNLSNDIIYNMTLDSFSPHRILNDTDPINYPELCICNCFNGNNEELEYFGLKVFDGDDTQDNMCLLPKDYIRLSHNLFCLLEENNWKVNYMNGKPMLYVICTSATTNI